MTHRLAVVDNFKRIHDAVGKDPAHLVRSLELIGIRSKNAYAVFENCSRCLQQTKDETKWKGYETKKEWRLRNKGRFGMNTRTCWFVVETQEQLEHFSLKYPGRILLLDRSQIQDALGEKPIDGTTLLHEVCSVETDIPTSLPRIWKAKIANLPCNCPYCTLDPINVLCPHSPWRKARIINVTEALKEGEVAVRAPFEGMLVGELKDLLRANNLRLSGNKAELLERLIEAGVQDNRVH